MSENTQTTTANLATVPSELRYATWSELAGLGIERNGIATKYTCRVTLPEGWSVQPTEHPHWKMLTDEHGRNRADIYHCDDFHGTRAFIAFRRRYTTRVELNEERTKLRVKALDGNEVLYTSEWFDYVDYQEEHLHPGSLNWGSFVTAETAVENWLASNLSGWKNPLSHWDCES